MPIQPDLYAVSLGDGALPVLIYNAQAGSSSVPLSPIPRHSNFIHNGAPSSLNHLIPPSPSSQTTEHHYDVVGHPKSEFKFAVVLPFHPGKDGAEPQVIYGPQLPGLLPAQQLQLP